VVADCLAVLAGDTDPALIGPLAGHGADKYFDGKVHDDTYWFRVWALRALLWEWDATATRQGDGPRPSRPSPVLARIRHPARRRRSRAAADRALIRLTHAAA
jgi:hypothetical protein